MMFLISAVALVGILGALNLLLTVGVIRRLREHSTLLAGSTVMPNTSVILSDRKAGEEIAEFSTTTVDGDTVVSTALPADTLVAFLATGCAPCKDLLPRLGRYLDSSGRDRKSVLAVIIGDAEDSETELYVAEMSHRAQIVVEGPMGELSSAFGVSSFPALLEVGPREGKIIVQPGSDDLRKVVV